MEPSPSQETSSESAGRWEFLRDVIVFQLKLVLDALRDLLLSPISIVAAAVDLLSGDERERRHFYRVLGVGRSLDVWINLFGESKSVEGQMSESSGSPTVDSLVGQVEQLLVEQYERGGVTASAKDAIDRSLDAIARKRKG